MEKLVFIIREMFPSRGFHIEESYSSEYGDKVTSYYMLWIEDICSESFGKYKELENYVYHLLDKSIVDEAKFIIEEGKNETN